MMDMLKGEFRTKYCGEFTEADLDKEVVAMGWVATRRDFGDLVFVDLRDRTGKLQVVFDKSKFKGDYDKVDKLRSEFVISVYGNLQREMKTLSTQRAKQVILKLEQLK